MRLPLFFTVILFCAQASAEIYRYVDASGRVQFTDKAPGSDHSTYKKSEQPALPSPAPKAPNTENHAPAPLVTNREVTLYAGSNCYDCGKIARFFTENNINATILRAEESSINEGRFVAMGGVSKVFFVLACGKSKLISWRWDVQDFKDLCVNVDPARTEVRKIPL
ncbi:DUF4124 domain-containing protein [Fluviicoccus keumensis]|uniref:DUF4124 domain-containing protein n=1 Tax=Fluviicoccus keumensis TaxID=1435465 RepID=UPI00102B7F1E|nr:DUF4124 domain-containing protein [Fluviicoccus keumensis]